MQDMNTDYRQLWNYLGDGSAAVAQQYPEKAIKSISIMHGQLLFRVQDKNDQSHVRARMGMGGEQLAYHPDSNTLTNARGEGVKSPAVADFMHMMHRLHMYFGLGEPGMIFLGIMCLLSLLSVLSGIVLYQPFMKKEAFGEIKSSSASAPWFSWHKFLGIATGLWAGIMCLSGVMIVVFSLSYGSYIAQSKSESVQHIPPNATTKQISAEQAAAFIEQQFDDKYIISVDLPDKANSEQYIFYLTDVRQHPADYMGQMVFVNAASDGQLQYYTRHLPIYLPAAAVMLDLHIHNHDLIALKIIWALLDIIVIVMIITGFIGWYRRYYKKALSLSTAQLHRCTEALSAKHIWVLPAAVSVLCLAAMILPLVDMQLSWFSVAAWIAAFIITIAAYIKAAKK